LYCDVENSIFVWLLGDIYIAILILKTAIRRFSDKAQLLKGIETIQFAIVFILKNFGRVLDGN
jgi:hypothetical protein